MSLPFGGRPSSRRRVNKKTELAKATVAEKTRVMLLENPQYSDNGEIELDINAICEGVMLPATYKKYINHKDAEIYVNNNFYHVIEIDIEESAAGEWVFTDAYWCGNILHLKVNSRIVNGVYSFVWDRFIQKLSENN